MFFAPFVPKCAEAYSLLETLLGRGDRIESAGKTIRPDGFRNFFPGPEAARASAWRIGSPFQRRKHPSGVSRPLSFRGPLAPCAGNGYQSVSLRRFSARSGETINHARGRRDHGSRVTKRMGGRAVEGTGLENQQGSTPFVGSNPTPSAIDHQRACTPGAAGDRETASP